VTVKWAGITYNLEVEREEVSNGCNCEWNRNDIQPGVKREGKSSDHRCDHKAGRDNIPG